MFSIHPSNQYNDGLSSLQVALWAFYLCAWEEYHTGILHLGYINGPTEGFLAAMGLILLSGIYGIFLACLIHFIPFTLYYRTGNLDSYLYPTISHPLPK